MGAIADYDSYVAKKATCRRFSVQETQFASMVTVNERLGNALMTTAPSTPAACYGDSSAAAYGYVKALADNQIPTTLAAQAWLAGWEGSGQPLTSGYNPSLIIDRLSHQGGLVGNVATAQTTNLPTAALPRYTTGEGVMAAITIYSSIGTTATTATLSYTNQAGTAGRTTKAIQIGATNRNSQGDFFICPLQDGDTGVRSVESLTLAATTGAAGNIGVVLFKPLFIRPFIDFAKNPCEFYVDGWNAGKIIEVFPNACLGAIGRMAVAANTMCGKLAVIEA